MPPKSKPKVSNSYTRELEGQIKQSNHILLVLDDDGTLAPMSLFDNKLEMASTIKGLLTKLTASKSVTVAIISGHSLLHMKKNFPVEGVVLAGNHGLEVEGQGLLMHHKLAENSRKQIHQAANTLRTQLMRINGVRVEDWGLSAILNYRLVGEDQVSSLVARARNLVGNYLREHAIKIVEGKKLLEIMPPVDWHRGKTVRALLHELRRQMPDKRILPLYFGDDKVDEDAFKYVNQLGMSWRVGASQNTNARFYLKTQTEISRPLKTILSHLTKLGTKQAEEEKVEEPVVTVAPTEETPPAPTEPLVKLFKEGEDPEDEGPKPEKRPMNLDELWGDDESEEETTQKKSETRIIL